MSRVPLMLLDRDGVILKHVNPYILKKEEVGFVEGSQEAMIQLASMGIPIAVITIQSPISRGFISVQFVNETNKWIQDILNLSDDQIKFYFCPHTSMDGCNCRKPKVGMLEQACISYNKKPRECWIVGDHDTDMQAGINFSVDKRIHLLSGRQALPSLYATDVFENLLGFVRSFFLK